ncbi:Glycerol-3-phosphate acyltransferase 4 [Oopsacas minuta]|uniref:Glycerol-3-phosphate acyltransferase 4 n=1 Tax=Oopsacas minuta TaxID=111878 RepID=A0AAV7JQG5_9METZ|nr:Glycerol-3-phosphate acyltransferase 4 [Oopsacas minuta]
MWTTGLVSIMEFFSSVLPNFNGILSLWFRIVIYLYVIQITPYLSSWSISLYIKGLRMLFHINKDQLIVQEVKIPRVRSYNTIQADSELQDVLNLIKNGIQSIVTDDVTERFTTQPFQYWNLMSRNQVKHEQSGIGLKVLWSIGMCFRYFLLFPVRLMIGITGFLWLIASYGLLALAYDKIPQDMYLYLKNTATLITGRLFIRAFTGHLTFEAIGNRPKNGSICVANHTTPLDVMVLSFDNVYSMVGQSQGGFFGLLQWAVSIGQPISHVWFNRFELSDRLKVTQRLREHSEKPNSNPILIFPEGTCINNTAVFMFKKGSFEVGAPIYPACIKYNLAFSDPFWNSSRQGFLLYVLMLMTSWAIVCTVKYLPLSRRLPGEKSIDFANRVKNNICEKGGLVDIEWDGQVKRQQPKNWPDAIKKKMMDSMEDEGSPSMKRKSSQQSTSSLVYFSFGGQDSEEQRN